MRWILEPRTYMADGVALVADRILGGVPETDGLEGTLLGV